MPAPFGATAAGVNALVPAFDITATSKPNLAQVEDWINQLAPRVERRMGSMYLELDPDVVSSLETSAAGVVELGAAAYTEDARFPERASKADTRYGAVLWSRYEQGLMELVQDVQRALDESGTVSDTGDKPAFSFPEIPYFTRSQGY